jgi:hypothetical protein
VAAFVGSGVKGVIERVSGEGKLSGFEKNDS